MSDLGFNKIAFCVLGTGLALIGLNEASHAMFHTAHHETDGYVIDIPEAVVGPAVVEGPRDYFKLISEASADAGKEVAKKCLQCHHFEPNGAPLIGPPLYGVLGRDIASVSGFKYSTGKGSLSEVEGVWDYAKLDHFLERPKGFAPATAMNFAGVNSRMTGQKDRANLTAYLRTLAAGEPLPLPAPLPEQPAAPAEGAVPAEGATPAPADGAAPTTTPANGATPAPAPATPAPTQPAPAPH